MTKYETKMAQVYTDNGGTNAEAVPWADIIVILAQLFGGCKPKAGKAWARDHEFATKALVNLKLKQEGLFPNQRNRRAAAEAAYETYISAKDVDIMEVSGS